MAPVAKIEVAITVVRVEDIIEEGQIYTPLTR
jgi:hypothetical protein